MTPFPSTSRPTAARPEQPPSGHVFRVDRKRGPVWYAKYRLPDGRQVQRKLGPAWSERGRPPAGYFTKRLAEDWLHDLLGEARRGTLPGLVRTGATVADAAAEYLRYIEHDRERKPSTVKGYRWIINAQILPTFGPMRLEDVTSEIVEGWLARMACKAATRDAFASCFVQLSWRRSPQPPSLLAPGTEPVKAAPTGPPTAGPDGPTLTEPAPSAERSLRSAGRTLPT